MQYVYEYGSITCELRYAVSLAYSNTVHGKFWSGQIKSFNNFYLPNESDYPQCFIPPKSSPVQCYILADTYYVHSAIVIQYIILYLVQLVYNQSSCITIQPENNVMLGNLVQIKSINTNNAQTVLLLLQNLIPQHYKYQMSIISSDIYGKQFCNIRCVTIRVYLS